MAGKTALVLIFGLAAGSIGYPTEEAVGGKVSLITDSLIPLETKNTSITTPSLQEVKSWVSGAREESQANCELLCRACNLTGNTSNGSCMCLDQNGSEVACAIRVRKSPGKVAWGQNGIGNIEFDAKFGGDEEDTGMRGERCLMDLLQRSQGVLQNTLGRGLKNMATEERLAEFRKRVESLRRKPVESEKTKVCDKEHKNPLEEGSAPLYVLPVSPYIDKNLGQTYQGDLKESVKIEHKEEEMKNEEMIVGEKKPSAVISNNCNSRSMGFLAQPSPYGRLVVDSSDMTKTSSYGGIKLPAQFLALTKIRERMFDVDKLPNDSDKPIEKEKECLMNSNPRASLTSVTVTVRPLAPLKLPDLAPKLPEPTIKLPELAPKLPELTPKIPEFTPKIPEFTPKIPEFTPKIPEFTPKIPEFTPKIPEFTPKIPEFTPKISEPTIKLPELAPKLPELTPKIPEFTPKIPEFSPKTPEFSPKIPELALKLPELSIKLPELTSKLPEFNPNIPELTPKLAEGTPELLQLTPKLSELTPKLHELTPKIPDPELPPKLPEIIPQLPEDTPKLPDITPKEHDLNPYLPDITVKPVEVNPIKVVCRGEIIQSDTPHYPLNIPLVPEQKDDFVGVSQTIQKGFQNVKETGPILEGIIAIPKHVRIK